MALTPGTRLGVYDVLAAIGEGGMGQVWRARDTKLNRDVALEVLPDSFAHDADRLARFTREAQTLASLNHALQSPSRKQATASCPCCSHRFFPAAGRSCLRPTIQATSTRPLSRCSPWPMVGRRS